MNVTHGSFKSQITLRGDTSSNILLFMTKKYIFFKNTFHIASCKIKGVKTKKCHFGKLRPSLFSESNTNKAVIMFGWVTMFPVE